MKSIINRLKYQIVNDLAPGKSVMLVTDSVSKESVTISKVAQNVDVFAGNPDIRAEFRKISRDYENVIIKKRENIGTKSDINYDLIVLDHDNFKDYIDLKSSTVIVFSVFDIDDDFENLISKFSETHKYSYFFKYGKNGQYASVKLTDGSLIDGCSGIFVLSESALDLNKGYSCLIENSVSDSELKNIKDDIKNKKKEIRSLKAKITRYERNLYLISGPLRAGKRIFITLLKKFSLTKIFGKIVKAIREGGFSMLKWRVMNYLGLKRLNAESDYSFLLSDNTEYVDIDSEYQKNIDFSGYKTDVKMLAYYLPQFHSFKENDEWWGKGFTEWSNTRATEPRFKGHYQPRTPHEDIGYYDLSNIETLRKQAELAKQHGIYGFCFYYYWFSGKRLMEKPVDMLLEHPEIDIPFCLCWANENWTRAWDGQKKDVLIAQEYSNSDDDNFIIDMKKYIDDKRYIRIGGKPLVVVYNPGEIPDCHKSFLRWREVARNIGLGEILIWTCQTANNTAEKLNIEDCIDAEVEFPPHNTWLDAFAVRDIDVGDAFANIFNYQKLVKGLLYNYKSGKDKKVGKKPIHHSCMMAWDNAARRKDNWFTYHNYSLKSLYDWTTLICEQARRDFDESERFVFINAWNEWAEGTYLEPDEKYGYANINTVSKALAGLPLKDDLAIINNVPGEKEDFKEKIAVQIHMFYTETLAETIENLNKIPYNFDCFVSTDTKEKADYIKGELDKHCKCLKAVVEVFENRGRDVAPFLVQMNDRIDDYDYVCHIHSKKTTTADHGNDWRNYTFKHLFGSEQNIRGIFDLFKSDEKLGLVFPEVFPPIEYQAEWGGNLEDCIDLLERFGIEMQLPQNPVFPVGNMFWARSEAIRPLFKLNLTADDFPEEMKQTNSTIAHCIERCWVYIAAEYGFGYLKSFNNCIENTIMPEKRRIAFYVHFNKDKTVSETDYRSLAVYKELFDKIIFISNSALDDKDIKKLNVLVDSVYTRENHGMDFGAWKYGLEQFGYDKLCEYDEVILLNNSTLTPVFDFKPVFCEMDKRGDDFWGITLFPKINDGSYVGKKCIQEHLQSYFVVFEKKVILSGEIKKFFDGLELSDKFTETVANGEINLTVHMKNCGFTYSAYLNECSYLCRYLNNYSLPYEKPTTLLLLGSPLIKKKSELYMMPEEKAKLNYLLKKFDYR